MKLTPELKKKYAARIKAEKEAREKEIAQLKQLQLEINKAAVAKAVEHIPTLKKMLVVYDKRMKAKHAPIDDLKAKRAKTELKLARLEKLAKSSVSK